MGSRVKTQKYLAWDGVYSQAVGQPLAQGDCLRRFSALAGNIPNVLPAPAHHVSVTKLKRLGFVLNLVRPNVRLHSVSQWFAPLEEFSLIRVRIKTLTSIKTLLLQIRDAAGNIVYVERLDNAQINALPIAPFAATAADSPLIKGLRPAALNPQARAAIPGCANVVDSPYTVTVWVSTEDPAAVPLNLDPATDQGAGRGDLRRHDKTPGKRKRPNAAAFTDAVGLNQTSVRVHSMALHRMTWPEVYNESAGNAAGTATATPPATFAARVRWAKYRLNEMGFYAGPVDDGTGLGANCVEFDRAVRRYQVMRGLNGAALAAFASGDFSATVPALSPVAPGQAFDNLIQSLRREVPREVFDAPGNLFDPQATVRLYLDTNRFYADDPEFEADPPGATNKFAVESDWYSRPWIPLRTSVLTEKRDGAGAGRAGDDVDVPEAAAGVTLAWTYEDRDEDYNRLPPQPNMGNVGTGPHNYNDAETGSLCREFISQVRADVRQSHPSRYHNARQDFGGLIDPQHDADNAIAVFARVPAPGQPLQYDLSAQDRAAPLTNGGPHAAVLRADERVYFRPSTIAGDNYTLAVHFVADLQRGPNNTALAAGRIAALKAHHLDPATGGARAIAAASATIELWRRVRILKFVHWGRATHAFDGSALQYPTDVDAALDRANDHYKRAYVELDFGPNRNTMHVDAAATDHGGHGVQADFAQMNTQLASNAAYSLLMGLPHAAPLQFDAAKILCRDLPLVPVTVPTAQEILDRLIIEPINDILAALGAGTTNALALKTKANHMEAAWWLLEEWPNVNQGSAAAQAIVHNASAQLLPDLRLILRHDPGRRGTANAFALVTPAPQAAALTHFQLQGGAYQCTYTDATNITADDYPDLIDAMLIPPAIRQEFHNWATSRASGQTPYNAPHTGYLWLRVGAAMSSLTRTLGGPALAPTDPRRPALKKLHETFKDYKEDWWGHKQLLAGANHAKVFDPGARPTGVVPSGRTLVLEESERIHKLIVGLAQVAYHWITDRLHHSVRMGLQRAQASNQYTDLGEGLILVHARIHAKIPGPPHGLQGGPYLVPGASMGDALGVAFLSHDTCMELSALIAHEAGHALFMRHWALGDGGAPDDHDGDDRACMMSYPFIWFTDQTNLNAPVDRRVHEVKMAAFRKGWGLPGEAWGQFTDNQFPTVFDQEFCGKCNLKLRGWNIRKVTRVSASGNPIPAEPPF